MNLDTYSAEYIHIHTHTKPQATNNQPIFIDPSCKSTSKRFSHNEINLKRMRCFLFYVVVVFVFIFEIKLNVQNISTNLTPWPLLPRAYNFFLARIPIHCQPKKAIINC